MIQLFFIQLPNINDSLLVSVTQTKFIRQWKPFFLHLLTHHVDDVIID